MLVPRFLVRAIACLLFVGLLSACSESPEQQGCDNESTQTFAKRLLLLHLSQLEAKRPGPESFAANLLKKSASSERLEAALNTVATKGMGTGTVTFSDIAELRNPLPDASSSTAALPSSGKLFSCRTKATVFLGSPTFAKLAAFPGLKEALDEAKGTMTLDAIYGTEIDEQSKDILVSFRFANPKADWLLGLAFAAAQSASTTSAATAAAP